MVEFYESHSEYKKGIQLSGGILHLNRLINRLYDHLYDHGEIYFLDKLRGLLGREALLNNRMIIVRKEKKAEKTYVNQLHDQVQFVWIVVVFVQANDVRMLDLPQNGHLVLDHRLFTGALAFIDHFQRVLPSSALVSALMHHREIAFADQLADLVIAHNRVRNHWTRRVTAGQAI